MQVRQVRWKGERDGRRAGNWETHCKSGKRTTGQMREEARRVADREQI